MTLAAFASHLLSLPSGPLERESAPLIMDVETTQSDLFFRLMAWLHANRKHILIGAIAIAVIALVIAVLSWHKVVVESDANAQFFAIPGVVGIAGHGEALSPTPLLDLAK